MPQTLANPPQNKNCPLSFVVFCGLAALRYWPSARIHFPSCESPQIHMDRTNPAFVQGNKSAWHAHGNQWQLSCHTSCQARPPKMTPQTQLRWQGKSVTAMQWWWMVCRYPCPFHPRCCWFQIEARAKPSCQQPLLTNLKEQHGTISH